MCLYALKEIGLAKLRFHISRLGFGVLALLILQALAYFLFYFFSLNIFGGLGILHRAGMEERMAMQQMWSSSLMLFVLESSVYSPWLGGLGRGSGLAIVCFIGGAELVLLLCTEIPIRLYILQCHLCNLFSFAMLNDVSICLCSLVTGYLI